MRLPDFVIAGERRCGTTSLYYWLQCHPEIYLPAETDMNFFIEDEIVGIRQWRDGLVDPTRWDERHSPAELSRRFMSANGSRATGFKNADLLFWRPAHARLARYLPEARFIFTLRHPVDRAWSHYWNEVGKGREWLSFEEALKAEQERCQRSDYARNHLSYLTRGDYATSLSAFFEHIPPSRVLIVTLEESRRNPLTVLRQIHEFLGVDANRGLDNAGTHHNENWTLVPRRTRTSPLIGSMEEVYMRVSEALIVRLIRGTERRRKARQVLQLPLRRPARNTTMPSTIRLSLQEHYAPQVQRLSSLLNRQFPEWGL